ncbi:MAG: hypothetical protein HC929_24005 [Leptolyngbyaceae cyanobacterium SM2_5_2]|nr:hypothetical protein [Leptolyngbyaceae cyanobacterium SM2_5_2]
MPTEDPFLTRRARLKAPKAAAIAGIVFSVLLIISLVLILSLVAPDLSDATPGVIPNQALMVLALNLVPFAGIAFLWFMGAVRDRLGDREDQFFATVFFGSGLLFLAMLFVSSAVAGGLILPYDVASTDPITSDYSMLGRTIAREILSNYGIRMAGVFMISACTLFIRTQVIPRWMTWIGYAFAALMLLRIGYIGRLGWVFLLFPVWVLLVSGYVLVDNYRGKESVDSLN